MEGTPDDDPFQGRSQPSSFISSPHPLFSTQTPSVSSNAFAGNPETATHAFEPPANSSISTALPPYRPFLGRTAYDLRMSVPAAFLPHKAVFDLG